MSYMAVGGGTLVAAVLGAGTAANTAASTASASGATGAGSNSGLTVRTAAAQVGHELARTGVGTTTMLLVLSIILLVAGFLILGLSRRYGKHPSTNGFAPPDLL